MSNRLNLVPSHFCFNEHNGLGIFKHSDWNVDLTIADVKGSVRTPIDLTGFTGSCVIRRFADDSSDVVAEPTVTISTDVTGLVSLSLDSTDTMEIPTIGKTYGEPSEYMIELFIDNGDDEQYRILDGTVTVSPSLFDDED